MVELRGFDHDTALIAYIQVLRISNSTVPQRAYKLKVRLPKAGLLSFIIRQDSPAADVDWVPHEWYQIENVTLKHWETHSELTATKQTTAKQVERPQDGGEPTIFEDGNTSGEAEQNNTAASVPMDRCGLVWPPDGENDETRRASCCYRETWREFNRCIWHADTDEEKPISELLDVRESKSNRIQNHLPREILAGAILRDTELTDELMTGVDFRGADFEGSNFTDVYLSYATFADANLEGVDFTESTVSRVDFSGANLTDATLAGLSLYDGDFTGATLTDANFTDANVEEATFENTNIESAIWVGTVQQESSRSPDNGKTERTSSATEPETDNREEESDAIESTTTTETESASPSVTAESIASSSETYNQDSIEKKVNKLQSHGATRQEALSFVSQYVDKAGVYSISGVGLSVGYQLISHGVTHPEELEPKHFDIIKQLNGVTDHHVEKIVENIDGLDMPANTSY